MKILYVTKYFPPEYGGIETLSKNICDFFFKKNKKIEVICFSKKKSYLSKSNKYNVYFFRPFLNLFSTPISISIILFILKNYKRYDCIHIHTPNPLIELILIFLPIKKLIISWGSDIINQKILKIFFNPIQYALLKKAKKIICLSNNYLKYSKDLKNFKKKIVIIPPIIKKSPYKPKVKNYQKINILMVGRLVDYKGYDIAIKTLSLLPKNYNLNIIGRGKNKIKLLNLIRNLKLNKRIKLLDKANDRVKQKYLKKSSLLLMCSTSRAESFGISILEAISNSLPLIISKVKGSGMNDMIINKFNGYKFDNFSSEDCAKKIIKLCESKKKLNLFSKNSLKLFNQKFNRKKIEKNLERIYY